MSGEAPTVTVTCTRKRYTLAFSKLPGQSFGPYTMGDAMGQLEIAADMTRVAARALVFDATTAPDHTATVPY